MYIKNQLTILCNSGIKTEFCHQGSELTKDRICNLKAICIKAKIALNTKTPRKAPNTIPSKRSKPDKPAPQILQLPM